MKSIPTTGDVNGPCRARDCGLDEGRWMHMAGDIREWCRPWCRFAVRRPTLSVVPSGSNVIENVSRCCHGALVSPSSGIDDSPPVAAMRRPALAPRDQLANGGQPVPHDLGRSPDGGSDEAEIDHHEAQILTGDAFAPIRTRSQ